MVPSRTGMGKCRRESMNGYCYDEGGINVIKSDRNIKINSVVIPIEELEEMYEAVKNGELYECTNRNGNSIEIDNCDGKIYIDISTVTTVEMSVEEFEKMYEAMK
jgi:hypothetical protein